MGSLYTCSKNSTRRHMPPSSFNLPNGTAVIPSPRLYVSRPWVGIARQTDRCGTCTRADPQLLDSGTPCQKPGPVSRRRRSPSLTRGRQTTPSYTSALRSRTSRRTPVSAVRHQRAGSNFLLAWSRTSEHWSPRWLLYAKRLLLGWGRVRWSETSGVPADRVHRRSPAIARNSSSHRQPKHTSPRWFAGRRQKKIAPGRYCHARSEELKGRPTIMTPMLAAVVTASWRKKGKKKGS